MKAMGAWRGQEWLEALPSFRRSLSAKNSLALLTFAAGAGSRIFHIISIRNIYWTHSEGQFTFAH